MIEILRIIGSALVAASATLLSLYLKRKWDKQDKTDEKKEAEEDKIDKMSTEVTMLASKVDKLTQDFEKELNDIRSQDRGLTSGLREILYDRIKSLSRKYLAENKIREEEYNSLQRMWKVYHEELGGNGYLDSVMREIEELEKY